MLRQPHPASDLIIIRAEDGETFHITTTLQDVQKQGSLKELLEKVTGVPQDSILSFLSDGQQIRDENLADFVHSEDQSIYVFNSEYLFLHADLDEAARELKLEARLESPIEPTAPLTSYLHAAHSHSTFISHVFTAISSQAFSLQVAYANLSAFVSSVSDTFDAFEAFALRELARQEELLRNHEVDLEIIGRVKIHPEFLRVAGRKAGSAGEGKSKTLGDYISNSKMKQVAEACAKLHDDLHQRFAQARDAVSMLRAETEEIHASLATPFAQDAEVCAARAQKSLERTEQVVSMVEYEPDKSVLWDELGDIDAGLRDDAVQIAAIKNLSTANVLRTLHDISHAQSTLATIPATLASLQDDFRANKGGFPHLARLHHMLYMYGATLVEIIRRKEFGRFFSERAHSLAELMAKLSTTERKRRQLYRSEVHGQLPFEVKGMDDSAPSLEISTKGLSDSPFNLERDDFLAFLDALNEMEMSIPVPSTTPDSQLSADADGVLHPVKDVKLALEKLIMKMDNLEGDFDKWAERSILSVSRMAASKRRSAHDESAYRDAIEQLRYVHEAKAEQDRVFQQERQALESEIEQLHEETKKVTQQQARADRLEAEMRSVHVRQESDARTMRDLGTRNADLLIEVARVKSERDRALGQAREQAQVIEALSADLAAAKKEREELEGKTADAARVVELVEEKAAVQSELEDARKRIAELEAQAAASRTENAEANRALKEATKEKDRLLKLQASEADRLLRDHIAETDGDRAVLEHQLAETKKMLEDSQLELKEALVNVDMVRADSAGLREELDRATHALGQSHMEDTGLRKQLNATKAALADSDKKVQELQNLVSEILEKTVAFRDTNARVLSSAQHSLNNASKATRSMAESAFVARSPPDGPSLRGIVEAGAAPPLPIDFTDPAAALNILSQFDLEAFSATVGKLGSTIRKWQKQCKDYRERAKGKISFRNFSKGDLALFLPTRNSVAKPWAAFNVSFPHYFLQATGNLAEQLKTREWVVARIISITEHVANQRDPSTNPFALGDGVKYYLCQVEDWTQNKEKEETKKRSQSSSRRQASSRAREGREQLNSRSTSPLSPASPRTETAGSTVVAVGVTHSPTKRQYGGNNATSNAGPSSLSRILAKAPSSDDHSDSDDYQPTPISPLADDGPPHHLYPTGTSPVRPPSTKSSASSHPSTAVATLPPFARSSSPSGSVRRAPATTALSNQSQPSALFPGLPSPPSPGDSAGEGMTSLLFNRRRAPSILTSSVQAPAASNPFATFATNWGMALGRRNKDDRAAGEDSSVAEILKRLDLDGK
ncbi:hypothetical protein BOTBODRAFT_192771 [Botryobasidium botryosum FD-172 SS1]|uniref:Autophagy-related protein 11 n=1 Tax=Botryobasidium botryosum (strain FD-172 SS1) TaxID=930990 RepID=A0A067LUW5_BOTB1|nr:hypothetical protein BOTBODRAFT_192771 [Botryobasidium botryosum FD-172 SS1]